MCFWNTSIDECELLRTNMANPTVLVTGGAKRIGKAIVEHFSRNGYSVIIHVSSSLEEGNHLAEELRTSGAKADVLQQT